MKKAVSGEYKKYLTFTYENVMRKPIIGYNLLMIRRLSDENKECTFLSQVGDGVGTRNAK